jgi:hypothetical protein
MIQATAPVTNCVRAYFAPVDRAANAPTLFAPAQSGRFDLDNPPAPWLDLGWISQFVRKSGTKVNALRAGTPAATVAHVRSEIEATLSLEFETWGKLQSALASGSQQTNLLEAAVPVPLLTGTGPASTATALHVGAAASAFAPGALIAVDADYTGQLGFIGAGISAAYLRTTASDIDTIRRVTLNVATVAAIDDGILHLATPLPAGSPAPDMQISRIAGFCDREGPSFFQEWSALFVLDGMQGDRILYHYPRLQAMQSSSESITALAPPLETIRLAAAFRALPVKDTTDGEPVLCFRTYLPAPLREI